MPTPTIRTLVVTLVVVVPLISVAPASAQQAKCLAGKTACMAKKAAGLLKCEALAETPGKPADPNANECVAKVRTKFDGGLEPTKGCFEKLESKDPNDCLTFDDTAAAETAVDGCVASLVAPIDPPPLDQTKCGAAKKKCASKYLAGLLKCRKLSQMPGKPTDPNTKGCVDKAVAKYTGGDDPTKGCFAKLEAKDPNDCQHTNDSATVRGLVEDCVADLVAVVGGPASTTSTTLGTTTSTIIATTTTTPTSTTTSTTSSSCPASLRCGTGCCARGQTCLANGTCFQDFELPRPPCVFPLIEQNGVCVAACGSTTCNAGINDLCCSSGPDNGVCCDGYSQRCSQTQTSCQTVSCPAGQSYVPNINDCCPNADICGSGSLTDCCNRAIEVCIQPQIGLPTCVPRSSLP
jgi:hypothetical protein